MTGIQQEFVRIPQDLHDRVRRHCDRSGVRLVDFVEQALEEALASEPVAEALGKEIAWLRRKTRAYDQAYNRGFQMGYALWFRMTTGIGLSEEEQMDLEAVDAAPPVVQGEQLKLF